MSRWEHHVTCPCGCDELSDECAGTHPNPFGSLRFSEPPLPNPFHPRDHTAPRISDDNDTAGGSA